MRTHICGGCGSREDVGYLVDATIAALQADKEDAQDVNRLLRRELDKLREKYDAECVMSEGVQSQLTQRTAERDTARRRVDELEAREVDVVLLRGDLEKRTAELEAANTLLYKKNCALGRAETSINDLQAELEALRKWRDYVTVALQRPGGAFFVDVPQHIKDLVKERDELRTLVLALPKVEGQWTVSCAMADRVVEGGIVSDISEAVAAIVKHRQGMEG